MKRQFLSKFAPALAVSASLFLGGCATSPPKEPDNICSIFKEHRSWYNAAKDAREKWGVPVHVPLAMMYQESSFKHNAAPPMEYFLWIIPIGRASDAYGYAQAKTMTWDDYVRETGNSWASRSDFDDAMDFMAGLSTRAIRSMVCPSGMPATSISIITKAGAATNAAVTAARPGW